MGEVTNQSAEFWAVNKALKWCLRRGLHHPTIRTDSKVFVDVVTGVCQLRNERLRMAYDYTRFMLQFLAPTFEHVRRDVDFQPFVDFLANLGIHNSVSYDKQQQHEALISAYMQWGRHG